MAKEDLTREALLPCSKESKVTKHVYSEAVAINRNPELGFDLMYECLSCGETRKWGNSETLHYELKKGRLSN